MASLLDTTLNRRTFVRLCAGLVLSPAAAYGTQTDTVVDLAENDNMRLGKTIRDFAPRIMDSYLQTGRAFGCRFLTEHGTRTVWISAVHDEQRRPRRLRIVRDDGEIAYLQQRTHDGKPYLSFADATGVPLVIGGKTLEYSLAERWENLQDFERVLTVGILAVMTGLILWIGIPFVLPVLAALGTLIFYAFALGLFLFLVAGVVRFVRRLVQEQGGWKRHIVEKAFNRRMQNPEQLLQQLATQFQNL